jgi:hypothetical protein
MEVIEASLAHRRVERAKTAAVAEREIARRGGFSTSARQEKADRDLDTRASELADGHVAIRFSSYLRISARTPEALVVLGRSLEQSASGCGIELECLLGDQARGAWATTPTGFGLS